VSDELAAAIAGVVGDGHVLTGADVRAGYERDWTGRFGGEARMVVRPGSTAEVADVVRACAEAGAAIVPQGGNTGLVGGSVPRGGEVVVSLTRLDGLDPVDEVAGQVAAGAGVTLERLQQHLRGTGFDFAVDYGARSAATIGGMVATNAGGVHVVRYGSMRAQVVGVEAVLADGSVIERMAGLVKDNAGYDLPGLLTGSEGTLAIVTRARLRLVRHLPERVAALFAVSGTGAAVDLFGHLHARLPALEAAELFYADGLRMVCEEQQIQPPFAGDHPAYLLIECADVRDVVEPLAAAMEDAPAVIDEAVADDTAARERLWAYREAHTEAINARGVPHKLDVTLPLAAVPAFADEVRERVEAAAPGAQVILFGHVGDGNLHVNVLGPEPEDESVDDAVLRLVAEHRGSVSAEHGIGVAKPRWLSLTRSPAEIAALRAIKRALDPRGLLNPGVLLPED
jgi:FAD/FMN-containing dehydrogenase